MSNDTPPPNERMHWSVGIWLIVSLVLLGTFVVRHGHDLLSVLISLNELLQQP